MSISFKRHQFSNGLRLVVHEDPTTPLASCFICYFVGSRDENPNQTGLAHLLEHYMFCGSKNIPEYDVPLDKVGAQNNAYTTDDITCYYITLPANNIETAFWLESDRMMQLAFRKKELEVQKNVVIEEFKEHFLNKPYGDMWMLFNEAVFEKHPYQWLPIGKEVAHIETVNMDIIKAFYHNYYAPQNAVIAIAGNVHFEEIVSLVDKWFGTIPKRGNVGRNIPQEPVQTQSKTVKVERKVPYDMLLKGWKMCGRLAPDFYALDLLSDILGTGKSSFLYQELVEKQHIFTDISASITATFDPGIFMISGRPTDGTSLQKANDVLEQYLNSFPKHDQIEHNLQKVKNNVESILLKNEIKIEDRATTLALSETFHSVERFQNDKENYFNVNENQLINAFCKTLIPTNETTLFYQCEKK
ncbi:MAG: insulinase family protein [Bacteroidetes bacterium]|nr:insulinase family protein [Bacteroidota bacterium]MCL1969196.1 insulinase family protein [Bacteroidota bacterium]